MRRETLFVNKKNRNYNIQTFSNELKVVVVVVVAEAVLLLKKIIMCGICLLCDERTWR